MSKSYRIGGAREDRTPDLLRARQALSQLSYGPILLVFFTLYDIALVTRSHILMYAPSFVPVCRAPCLRQKILRKIQPSFSFYSLSHSPMTFKQNVFCANQGKILCSVRQHMSNILTPSSAKVVGLGGFEPPTSPLSGVRSNQLSYRPRLILLQSK